MRRFLLLVAVCAAAAYVVVFGLGEGKPGLLAFDVYGYYYPHVLYALRSLAAGGQGLLWNPFQNCGQPFFAISETGLLYPPNLLYLVLDPSVALRAVLFTNLVIAGLGTYALGREIGVSPVGSAGAALAFVLGNAAYHLTTWMPTVQAPYAWMPVAMWCCERLLNAPSLSRALVLGMALAAALLPGHPQFVLFTCQLIALRLLWSVVQGSPRIHVLRAVGGVALAFAVMLLLTAVQYLPALEVFGESIRHVALRPEEIAPGRMDTWKDLGLMILRHQSRAPFSIIPGFIAAAALVGAPRRGLALFYLLAGGLFLVLSFGDRTPIGQLYYEMPLAGLFRQPPRFRFVTAFCVALLSGMAVDTLAAGSWRAVAVAAACLLGLYIWLGWMWPTDYYLAAVILLGGVLAATAPATRRVAAAAIVVTIALTAVLAPPWTIQRFLADERPLRVHADVLDRLRRRITPQDRVHLALPSTPNAGFLDKTALLFQLRATTDYELQLSQRYAQYLTMLRRSEPLRSVNQVHYPGAWNPATISWPLVNLTAARYLVIDKSHEGGLHSQRALLLTFLDDDAGISIYENPSALPRAFYVAQIAVEPDADTRLQRLAAGDVDARRVALVDAAPASGFLGVAGNQRTAEARFVVDDPEHVVIETVAPERGFLFLADQYFPAWTATVNGQPAPILVANHAFRAVEVPPGPVTVEFRYRAGRVWVGAMISATALLVVGWVVISARRR
jgi:hypothetical protein